jgi:uncharacterized protein
MQRLLILVILGYILYRLLKWFFRPGEGIERGGNGKVIDEMVQDPNCKTYIPRRDSIKRVINGETHYFCGEECASEFDALVKSQK